jgi:hypothetical protein
MNENKSVSRTVAQKMGVKENSRAFLVNSDEEEINNIEFPPLDISTQLAEGFDYIHNKIKYRKMRKLIMWNVITLEGYFEGNQNWDFKPFGNFCKRQSVRRIPHRNCTGYFRQWTTTFQTRHFFQNLSLVSTQKLVNGGVILIYRAES